MVQVDAALLATPNIVQMIQETQAIVTFRAKL